MNSIKKIQIKNFKSIQHLEIDDCRRINLFVGYPNVGKSNILEALSIFSIDETNYDFSSFVRIENLTTLFYNGEINKQAEIRINDKHRFVLRFQKDIVSFEQQFERAETSFEKEDSRGVYSDGGNNVLVKKKFQLVEDKRSVINYGTGPIGKENWLREIRKYEFSKRIQYLNQGYSTLSYPYGENIFNIISTNEVLRKEVEELFRPYNLELLYDSRAQGFTILKRTSNGIFTIPYELIADTLQRVIFYKSAVLSNKQSVLLFEEPEAHMFPPYISKFAADAMYDKNDNQFFINTHSPFVINDLMENMKKEELNIYIVGYKKETGETVVRRLTDAELHEIYQYGIDLYMNLENFLIHEQQ